MTSGDYPDSSPIEQAEVTDELLPGSPGPERLSEACQILTAWGCPPATLKTLRAIMGTGAAAGHRRRRLAAFLVREDPSFPWLAHFRLDDTLAALAMILANARAAAAEAEASGSASPRSLPCPVVRRCEQFGMWELKRELADCRLMTTAPSRCLEVREWFHQFREVHRETIDGLVRTVREEVERGGVQPEVWFDYCSVGGADERLSRVRRGAQSALGRPELFGTVRAIMPSIRDCYAALEAIHSIGVPEPGQFQDRISAPAGNGYSGLLTSVWMERGLPNRRGSPDRDQPVVRVAIQTPLMAELSYQGIAHPRFRAYAGDVARSSLPDQRCLAQLARSLLGDRASTITVFTAKGEARQVPTGATALDLAYRIHTEVGNYAISAEVNGRRADLESPLPPGARVTIFTDPAGEGRTEGDLSAVVEAVNRRRIVTFLNRKPVRKGRHAVANYLQKHDLDLQVAELDALTAEVAERHGYPDAASLYKAVADSERRPSRASPGSDGGTAAGSVGADILRKLQQVPEQIERGYLDPAAEWIPSFQDDRRNERVRRFRICAVCRPSRMSGIVGVERRNLVTVHLPGCRWAHGRSVLPLRWQKVDRMVTARLTMLAADRPRLLAEVLQHGYELHCGFTKVDAAVLEGGFATINLKLYLRSAIALVQLIEVLKHVRSVHRVTLEENSLPRPLAERIRRGPRDDSLLSELQESGYGELSGSHILIPPAFVERRGIIRLPYSANKPTHSPRAFFGRQADARWLVEHTVEAASGGAALILGTTRVGKTSLCLRFLDNQGEAGERWERKDGPEIIRLDLRDLAQQTTEQAFASMYGKLRRLVVADGPPTAAGVVDVVRRGVEARAGRHVVLVLDEFGGPVYAHAEGRLGTAFFDMIPQLMDAGLPLSLVLVAIPEAHELVHRTGLWAHLRGCKDRELGALDASEARRMIVRPFADQGIQWDDRAVRAAAHLCGHLPIYIIFLLQELVHELNANPRKSYVRADDVEAATDKLLKSSGMFAYLLARWGSSPVKQRCVRAFLRHARSGAIDEDTWRHACYREERTSPEVFDAAVNSLVADGVLVRSASTYSFAVPIFRRWLQRNLASAARSRSLGLQP